MKTWRNRRQRRKKILRRRDGSLYDLTEDRRISAAELRDHVRSGGYFEARRYETGEDCTYELLQSMIGTGLLETYVPGYGGTSGLGPLGALSGGSGLLGAVTGRSDGLGPLAQIARVLADDTVAGDWSRDRSDGRRRYRDAGWHDWDDPPRWRREPGWDDRPRRSRHDGWGDGDDRPRGYGDSDWDGDRDDRPGRYRHNDWDDDPDRRRAPSRRPAGDPFDDDWADRPSGSRRRRGLEFDDEWGR